MRFHQLLAKPLLAAWPDHCTTWDRAHPCTQRHHASTCVTSGSCWMMVRDPFLSAQPPPFSARYPPWEPPCPPAFTRFVYPGPVAIELPLDLLLAPQLHEGSAVLHPLTLFGKLPAEGQRGAVRVWLGGSWVHRGAGRGGRDQGRAQAKGCWSMLGQCMAIHSQSMAGGWMIEQRGGEASLQEEKCRCT